MKKVCVTTWKGFRGYDKVFEIGKDCIVVNSDEEFASQIINLLQDDKLRESITESAYTKQQTYYTQSAFNKVIADNIK